MASKNVSSVTEDLSPDGPHGRPPTPEPDEDQDESREPAAPSTVSRRGFLGAAAAIVGTAAAAAVAPQPVEAAAAPDAAVAPVALPDMAAMAQQFMALMAERDARHLALMDERLAAIRSEIGALVRPPPSSSPSPNGVVPAHDQPVAELAADPGRYPPSMQGLGQPVAAQPLRRQPRMVAFIPKEDSYNPRQTTFRTWINGRELRSKRGQVMILSLGHGVDLAKNGHGNCVDIAAMQGLGVAEPMAIPTSPDFSRPATWDGLPLTTGSSFDPRAYA